MCCKTKYFNEIGEGRCFGMGIIHSGIADQQRGTRCLPHMFMYVKGFSAKSSPSLDVADASNLKMSEIF